MRIEEDQKLDFDDVLIRPKRSGLSSRSEVHLERGYLMRNSGKVFEGVPIIASNMDTVGTFDMAMALYDFDAVTALHKHYGEDDLIKFLTDHPNMTKSVFLTFGITEADWHKLRTVMERCPVPKICLDVANGYTEQFVAAVRNLRETYPDLVIMAGNVVTADMTEALILAGADIVKVGIGPGSVCTTRKMTGIGYPQLSAIIECADAAHGLDAHICADGGCRTPGDIVKAFAGGADFVMLGGMLAGHRESGGTVKYEYFSLASHELEAGEIDRFCDAGWELSPDATSVGVTKLRRPIGMEFYGMSSDTAMKKYHGGIVAKYRASEGKTVTVPYRGEVGHTMREILGGIRSACTYVGAETLKQLPKRATFVRTIQQYNTEFGK